MKKAALIGNLLAVSLAVTFAARAGENSVAGADNAPFIDLKTVRERPAAYQATPFKFDGQFYSVGTLYSPFYTVFEPARYINFSAWDDAEPVWNSRGYANSYPMLYLSRGRTKDATSLTRFQRFDRFRATAIVRATIGQYAFVEVLAIEPLDKKLSPTAVHHLIRAYRHKTAEEYDVAALHFADAFQDTLPDHVASLVRREEGECYLATGAYEQAVVAFAEARDLDENNADLKRLYDHAVALRTAAEERIEAHRPEPQPEPDKPVYEPFDKGQPKPEEPAPSDGANGNDDGANQPEHGGDADGDQPAGGQDGDHGGDPHDGGDQGSGDHPAPGDPGQGDPGQHDDGGGHHAS
ncbi:MAG: hypothetical protein U1E76_11145 [Planctomycetota bacterium]